jgi:hypothetical protein
LLLNYTPISSTDLVSTGYIAFVHTETMPFIDFSQCASLESVKCLAENPVQVTSETVKRGIHNALASMSRLSIGASDSQIIVPSTVNGEVVLPLSPDIDMPPAPPSETFGQI